jgi:hypothetical protein
MATKIMVSTRYGTHLPCLMKALDKSSGDVLELGMGVFSTSFLHYYCTLHKRKLVSYENYESWYKFFATRYGYQNEYHELKFVEDYKNAPIEERFWDVVLVDQTPDTSRPETVQRLANKAKFIVIHDSGTKFDRQYGYDKIYPLFKYRADWTEDTNNATVLSNFVDLKEFWI